MQIFILNQKRNLMRNLHHSFEKKKLKRREQRKWRRDEWEIKLNKQSILCSLQQMKIAVRLNKKTKTKNKRYILCLNEYVYIYI